jgi:hypothetical protein
MAQTGQVIPLEPTQVSAGHLPGHFFQQLAGAENLALFPGTLGQSDPGSIGRHANLIALSVCLGLGIQGFLLGLIRGDTLPLGLSLGRRCPYRRIIAFCCSATGQSL